MGLYLEDHDKKSWLEENGTLLEDDLTYEEILAKSEYPVCLVDNYRFYAAGVAFSKREFDYFKDNSNDNRPKVWYRVSSDLLKPKCPNWETYIKKEC